MTNVNGRKKKLYCEKTPRGVKFLLIFILLLGRLPLVFQKSDWFFFVVEISSFFSNSNLYISFSAAAAASSSSVQRKRNLII